MLNYSEITDCVISFQALRSSSTTVMWVQDVQCLLVLKVGQSCRQYNILPSLHSDRLGHLKLLP